MIQNAAFRRKVTYLGLIALLLIPLYVVGHPAVGDPLEPGSAPGGRLSQLRAEHDLSPAQLGEVDPTSESMKLATLGMRGVAATILWQKAHEFKKKENWEGLVAVVNQMAKLQPNFISVWEFQSHNLTYNISVEQDDYRFRYLWVKKGIEFLIKGTHYNRREPKLFWTVGWYTGQKFNRADESKQFRRLFKADTDFHDLLGRYVDIDSQGGGADGRPDSWLVSRLWYLRAYDIVDTQSRPIRGKAPHIFYADGPKALMNYAGAIEEDGYLDERAEYAWKQAGDEWDRYGSRQVPTSNGLIIRLNDEELRRAEGEELARELDALAPEARQTIRQEKINRLTTQERVAFETDPSSITDMNTYVARNAALSKTAVAHVEVAQRAPSDVRARAYRLAQQIAEAELLAEWISRYRENVNFKYWRTRCRIEQLNEVVTARRHIYNARQAKDKVELDLARNEYDQAWKLWAGVIQEYPILLDELTDDDLYEHVEDYLKLLRQLDLKLADDFPLRELVIRRGAPIAFTMFENPPVPQQPASLDQPPEPAATSEPPPADRPAKPDDAKPDDAKPDDAKPDDAKPDDAKPDDVGSAGPGPVDAGQQEKVSGAPEVQP